MTMSLTLPPETEARLAEQAQAAGKDVQTYAADVLRSVAARPSLDELLAPVRKAFAESGMTEDELSDQLEREKHDARAAARGRPFDE